MDTKLSSQKYKGRHLIILPLVIRLPHLGHINQSRGLQLLRMLRRDTEDMLGSNTYLFISAYGMILHPHITRLFFLCTASLLPRDLPHTRISENLDRDGSPRKCRATSSPLICPKSTNPVKLRIKHKNNAYSRDCENYSTCSEESNQSSLISSHG
jgi:hypothetical protein